MKKTVERGTRTLAERGKRKKSKSRGMQKPQENHKLGLQTKGIIAARILHSGKKNSNEKWQFYLALCGGGTISRAAY